MGVMMFTSYLYWQVHGEDIRACLAPIETLELDIMTPIERLELDMASVEQEIKKIYMGQL